MTRTRRAFAVTVALVGALLAFAISAGSAAADSPYSTTATVSTSTTTVVPGGTITITVTGYQPGETVVFTLHSDPVVLGSAVADSAGSATLTAAIPSGFSGSHSIEAVGQTSGVSKSVAITVEASSDADLASTGVAVIGIGGLGAVLLIVGGVTLMIGRRRTSRGVTVGV